MSYIIKSDIIFFLKENKWKIFVFYVFNFLFFMITNSVQDRESIFFCQVGSVVSLEDYLGSIMFFFHLFYEIYLIDVLFCKDAKKGIESLFLRIPIKKWLQAKIISTIFITFFGKFILYVGLFFLYKEVSNIPLYFLFDLFLTFSYQSIFLVLCTYIKGNVLWIFGIFVLLIEMIQKVHNVSLLLFIQKKTIILFLLGIMIGSYFLIRKRILRVFERSY